MFSPTKAVVISTKTMVFVMKNSTLFFCQYMNIIGSGIRTSQNKPLVALKSIKPHHSQYTLYMEFCHIQYIIPIHNFLLRGENNFQTFTLKVTVSKCFSVLFFSITNISLFCRTSSYLQWSNHKRGPWIYQWLL